MTTASYSVRVVPHAILVLALVSCGPNPVPNKRPVRSATSPAPTSSTSATPSALSSSASAQDGRATRRAACALASDLLAEAASLRAAKRWVRAERAAQRAQALCPEQRNAAQQAEADARAQLATSAAPGAEQELRTRVDTLLREPASDQRRAALLESLAAIEQQNRTRLAVRPTLSPRVLSASFADNGRSLLLAHAQGVSLLRTADWQELERVPQTAALHLEPGSGASELLVTAGTPLYSSDKIEIRRRNTLAVVATIPSDQKRACALALSPSGKLLAIRSQDQLALWRLPEATLDKTLAFESPHEPPCLSGTVAFSPSGEEVSAVTDTWKASTWNVRSGKKIATFTPDKPLDPNFPAHLCALTSERLASVTHTYVGGCADLRTWDARTRRQLRNISPPCIVQGASSSAPSVQFFPDGRRLVVSASLTPYEPTQVCVLGTTSAGGDRCLENAERVRYEQVTTSPSGDLVLGAGEGVAAWNAATGKQVFRLGRPEDTDVTGSLASRLVVSRDGARLAIVNNQGSVKLFSAATAQASSTSVSVPKDCLTAPVASFSPEGQRLLVNLCGAVTILDSSTAQVRGTRPGVKAAAWSPAGQRLVIATESTLEVWDPGAETPDGLRSYAEKMGDSPRITPCQGTTRVAAALADKVVLLDTATKEIVHSKNGLRAQAIACAAGTLAVRQGSALVVVPAERDAAPFRIPFEGDTIALSPLGDRLVGESCRGLSSYALAQGGAPPKPQESKQIEPLILEAGDWIPRLCARDIHERKLPVIEFSADGTRLLRSRGPVLELWSTASLTRLASAEVTGGGDGAWIEHAGDVALYGASAKSGLLCGVGTQLYPFALCEERYVWKDALLAAWLTPDAQ